MSINEDLKKIVLAGIGAVSITAEKSKNLIDNLVKKGEFTVEQGKILNEELKWKLRSDKKDASKNTDLSEVIDKVDKLSPEDIEKLKLKLNELDKE